MNYTMCENDRAWDRIRVAGSQVESAYHYTMHSAPCSPKLLSLFLTLAPHEELQNDCVQLQQL